MLKRSFTTDLESCVPHCSNDVCSPIQVEWPLENQFLFQFKSITPMALSQNSLAAVRELKATSVATSKIVKSAEKSAAELSSGSVIRRQLDSLKKMIEKLEK